VADYLLDFTADFRLETSRTALLVVDMQYASGSRHHGLGRLLAEAGRADDGRQRFDRIEQVVVPGIQRLLAFFRRHGLRVVYLTVGSELPDYADLPPHMRGFARAIGNTRGNREHEIVDELAPQPGELVLNKTTTGAFASSTIDALLRTLGVTDLVLTGVSTNSCVESTLRAAADLGYRCVAVEDACGAARPEYHEAALTNVRRQFGRVLTVDEVIGELELASLAGSLVGRRESENR
jgi:nicotinamidase-related amidase